MHHTYNLYTRSRTQKMLATHLLHTVSRTPWRKFSPSKDILLRTRDLVISIWGGGSVEKHTTMTVKLSHVFLLKASCTSSLAHFWGSLCAMSPFLTIVTAHWLLMTSQRPSQPMIKNSSSSDSVVSCSSGSALNGLTEPLGPFMCQSPRALATESCPFRYPS